MLAMITATLTSFAQYPTIKTIKGQEVVIMTVPQAQIIDNKFLKLRDSVKLLSLSLYENKEALRVTNTNLSETDKALKRTKDSLNQTVLLNGVYQREIERYKKMEFEDRRINKRVTVGFATAAVVWIFYVVTALSKQ